MKTRIETIWDEIVESARLKSIAEGSYTLRRIDPAFRFDVFAGVDASQYLMLAIGVSQTPPAIKLESTALDYFRQQRADRSWLMALRLRQPALSGVFGRLCQDLIDATASVSTEDQLVSLVRDRLNLWRNLFDLGTGGQLQPYKVKGLIAELLVLENRLASGPRSAQECVNAWTGPSRADQDFQFLDECIEVKAVGPEAEVISVSSLEQLASARPLSLIVKTLRPSAPGEADAVGLNILVPRIEGRLAASADSLALFKRKVLEAGYVEAPFYDSVLFNVLGTEIFQVTPEFPKLTSESVPEGIVSGSYAVSLNHMRKLRGLAG